jgi:hypothetical protein
MMVVRQTSEIAAAVDMGGGAVRDITASCF